MKKFVGLFAAIVFCSFTTGCLSIIAPENDMMLKGRWGSLEKYMEKEVPKLSAATSYELYNLCDAYANLKKYDKLFPCLDQFETNIQKGKTTVMMYDFSAHPNLRRSVAYMELGNYNKAINEAEKAFRITEENNLSLTFRIQSLGVLSLAHALKGNRTEAIGYAGRLEETSISVFTAGSAVLKPDKAIGLARTYMALGDYQKSLRFIEDEATSDFFRNSTNILVAVTGLMTPDDSMFVFQTMPIYYIYAKSLYETGDVKKAKEQYDKLLEKPQTKFNGEIYWMILYDRGRIAEQESNIKEAVGFYTKAVDVIEQQRTTINTEASKIGFVGDKQTVYHHLVRALYRDKQYEKAFEYVERAKSRALVDLLASKKEFAVKGGDKKEVLATLAMNDSVESEMILQDETATDKAKTRSIQVKTKNDLKKQAPELASLVTVASQPVSELQSLVPADEALIEYYYQGKDLYAFVLFDGKLRVIELDGEGLAEDIKSFRSQLEDPASTRFRELSGRLYRRLFQPLQSTLTKRALIIVPHGVLHYLPMGALHDGNGYLIDRYSIRMMPSASAMKYLVSKQSSKAGGVLIFGNPDLGDAKYDLEFAQQEAKTVAGARPNSRIFIRKEATEEALRKYGKDYTYLHFATHGQFNPDAPLKSALLLAPDAGHNGMLTVDKLYSLNLDADLVTLSACETGLSKIANGDDLVGLSRGFLYAGARSIVASLWKVDDQSTSSLMAVFYRELGRQDKREALRTAQLETKQKYAHPYYWAPFQLTGNAK